MAVQELDGRVAIITGAGRGIGRAYALLFAAEGARVVVNDADLAEAKAVVAEIEAAGGQAVADGEDCASWDGGRRLVAGAVDGFGRLDVLVNNAGILRDRAIVNMDEDEWDDVIRVHLKGHFVPTRFAAEHWRAEHKAGRTPTASIVHTSSTSGLVGNPGQSNYGAAKAGIAAFAAISAQELGRYGVRCNCVCPSARTRLSETAPGVGDMIAAPDDDRFDVWSPDERRTDRRLPRHRRLPVHRRDLLRAGRGGEVRPPVVLRRRGRARRAVVGRRPRRRLGGLRSNLNAVRAPHSYGRYPPPGARHRTQCPQPLR